MLRLWREGVFEMKPIKDFTPEELVATLYHHDSCMLGIMKEPYDDSNNVHACDCGVQKFHDRILKLLKWKVNNADPMD